MFEFLVFTIAANIVVFLSVCLISADAVEKHDERVRLHWEEARQSEPPEWADPEKWWESEGWC